MFSKLLIVAASFLIISSSLSFSFLAQAYYKDILNPISLFLIAWFVPYGLYIFYPYPPSIQPRLSVLAHIVILWGGITFLLGFFLDAPSHRYCSNRKQRFRHSSQIVLLAIGSMFLLSSIAFSIQFLGAGGLEQLISNADLYERHFFQSPFIDDFFNLIFIVAFVAAVYLKKGVRGLAASLLIVVGFFYAIGTLHRQRLILMGFLVMAAINYYHHRITLREALFVIVVGISGLIAIVASLSWGLTGGAIGRSGIIVHPVITQVYWYIAMGMQNVEIVVTEVPPGHIAWPVFSLEFLWTMTGTRQEVSALAGFEGGSLIIPFEMTFSTWLYVLPFYTDAGLLGVGVGSAAIGYGSARIYNAVRKRQHIGVVFIHGLVGVALLMTFFNNWFTRSLIWKLAVQFGLLIIVMNLTEKHIVSTHGLLSGTMDAERALKNSISYQAYSRVRNNFRHWGEQSSFINWLRYDLPWNKLREAWKTSVIISAFRLP